MEKLSFTIFFILISALPAISHSFDDSTYPVTHLAAGVYFLPLGNQSHPNPPARSILKAVASNNSGAFENHLADIVKLNVKQEDLNYNESIDEDISYCSNYKNWGGEDRLTTVGDFLTCLIQTIAAINEKENELINNNSSSAQKILKKKELLLEFYSNQLDHYKFSVKAFKMRDPLTMHKDNILLMPSFSKNKIPGHIRGKIYLMIKNLE